MESSYTNKHFDLVMEARNGSSKAQHQLYKLYAKSMYNVSMRILNHVAEAEDVVQESFVYVFMKMDEYRQESSFGAWLKQIVVNRSINVIRKRKASILDFHEELEDRADIHPEVDEEEIQWQVNEIRESMNYLPEGYRLVLSLYLVEGYDHEEIAEILKISESTSRTQYMRAKQKLLLIMKNRTAERIVNEERRIV